MSKSISVKTDTSKNYKINNNKNLVTTSNTSSYTNINSYSKYSSNNLQKNQNSKSYTNINNINSNLKSNLNINTQCPRKITANIKEVFPPLLQLKVNMSSRQKKSKYLNDPKIIQQIKQ